MKSAMRFKGFGIHSQALRSPKIYTLKGFPKTIVFSLMLLCQIGLTEGWKQSSNGFFTVETASIADEAYLTQVFKILEKARADLQRQEMPLGSGIVLRIHPNLDSYLAGSGQPWYIAGISNKAERLIQIQRLDVLLVRSSLEITIRHELFHMAHPDDWPRWQAEGRAMLFAGENPQVDPFTDVSEQQLELILASPDSLEELKRAGATAYFWVRQGKN